MQTETAAGSASPVRHHDPNVRQRLVDVAVALFAERGYATTSVREIVERAGVSKPVLYYHFGSKEGLYLEIMRLLERTVHETVRGLRTPRGSARSRIRSLILGIWDVFSENTAAVRFVNAVFWGPPQGAPAFDVEVLHRPLTDAFQALVDDGVARRELREDAAQNLPFALLGTLSFAMDFHLAHPDRSPGRDGLSRVLDLVLSGASKPRPSGAPR
ncbi:MAG TPA: TetR/AcrR family transcriptional regulator [Thermoanaerobaculia bacterium]|nr:TetR/AcrR family transcriptional regulator [Thermoanaerobaculia bacterium]HQR65912.1 TetR/AcrR family transcriptional regulator [Thermoanaerobaculia bacterium]